MSSQGAVPAMSGDPFTGLTEAEKKFLQALEKFLGNYPGYAGATPYDQAIARTLHLSVTPAEERALMVRCRYCPDPWGNLYCCKMPSSSQTTLD
jgi:hypothetical protein